MNWRIEFRPEVEVDMAGAAEWYEARQPGLGSQFIEDVITTWHSLELNPMLNSKRHPTKNIRWRFAGHFPYRIIYEISELDRSVLVIAILHAARDNLIWRNRINPC